MSVGRNIQTPDTFSYIHLRTELNTGTVEKCFLKSVLIKGDGGEEGGGGLYIQSKIN